MDLIPELNLCRDIKDLPSDKLSLDIDTIKNVLHYVKLNNAHQILKIMFKHFNVIDQIFCLLNANIFYEILKTELFNDYLSKNFVEKLSNLYFYNMLTKKNSECNMIKLNNKYNQYYNFDDVDGKVNSLKGLINIVISSKEHYYLGQESVKYLFGNYKKSNKVNYVDIVITSPTLINGKNYHIDSKHFNIVLKIKDNLYVIIYNISNKYGIKTIFDHYNNQYVIDLNNNILLNPKYFDKLNEQVALCDYNLKESLTELKSVNIKTYNTNKLNLKRCYCCRSFKDLHYYEYDSMCIECGIINKVKRDVKADLGSCKVFISGIRQKIGFCAALKMLRCGATVYGTSRYPGATMFNFKKEDDYEEFGHRLHIIKCDFLNLCEVSDMIVNLKKLGLNAIINNACQTTMPSVEYLNNIKMLEGFLLGTEESKKQIEYKKDSIVLQENIIIKLNEFGDVLEPNLNTSWRQKIDDVSPAEIISANQINLVVPTLIINQLKPHLVEPKFIINVTAIEGNFKTKKNTYHAHTNSYKAGLNMLTKTIAEEKGLYAYCIDPGFVSGVLNQPYYPIKMEDGGARIIDPIISYYNREPIVKGVNLKNYLPYAW